MTVAESTHFRGIFKQTRELLKIKCTKKIVKSEKKCQNNEDNKNAT